MNHDEISQKLAEDLLRHNLGMHIGTIAKPCFGCRWFDGLLPSGHGQCGRNRSIVASPDAGCVHWSARIKLSREG